MHFSTEKEVKDNLGKMLEECGLDEHKWREYLNKLPMDQRSMSISFDVDGKKDAFVFKFNYIITTVELELDPEVRKDIEENGIE
jgi:hypothetical protein